MEHPTGREWRTLAAALHEVTIAGTPPPCSGPQRDLWTDEAAGRRAIAVRLCRGCPVFAQCREAAEAVNEQWHVWGGIDRTSLTRELRRRPSPVRHAS